MKKNGYKFESRQGFMISKKIFGLFKPNLRGQMLVDQVLRYSNTDLRGDIYILKRVERQFKKILAS